MNYKKIRIQAGLSKYTIAKELGISYDKYEEVEKDIRPLEDYYIDRFYETINNASEIKLKLEEKLLEINKSIKNGKLRKRVKEYGYTFQELAKATGISQGSISNVFNQNTSLASSEFKEIVYDFLNNPINKKVVVPQQQEIQMSTIDITPNANVKSKEEEKEQKLEKENEEIAKLKVKINLYEEMIENLIAKLVEREL